MFGLALKILCSFDVIKYLQKPNKKKSMNYDFSATNWQKAEQFWLYNTKNGEHKYTPLGSVC